MRPVSGLPVSGLPVSGLPVSGLPVLVLPVLVLPVLVLPVLVLLVLGLLILSHRRAVAQKITPLQRRRPFPPRPLNRRRQNAAYAAAPIKSRIYQQTASIKQQKAAP